MKIKLLPYFLSLVMAVAASPSLIAQERICGYELTGHGAATAITSNSQTRRLLDEVMTAGGLQPARIKIRSAGVDNAFACENPEPGGNFSRYILYNPTWLNQLIQEVGTEWTARAILAHEVGHHVKSHAIRNNQSCDASLELEADAIAGEILAKLGAKLPEAQAAFAKISDDDGDDCYPSKATRLAAVKTGWESYAPVTSTIRFFSGDGVNAPPIGSRTYATSYSKTVKFVYYELRVTPKRPGRRTDFKVTKTYIHPTGAVFCSDERDGFVLASEVASSLWGSCGHNSINWDPGTYTVIIKINGKETNRANFTINR